MLFALRYWKLIAAVLALAGLAWAVIDHFADDRRVQSELSDMKDKAADVVLAIQHASGNADVDWQTAPGQIVALGDSNRALKTEIAVNNIAINELARRAKEAKAKADELQAIVAKAQAQRAAALRRLSDMAITPGTREDCLTLLREAEEALDLVWEASR